MIINGFVFDDTGVETAAVIYVVTLNCGSKKEVQDIGHALLAATSVGPSFDAPPIGTSMSIVWTAAYNMSSIDL